MNYVILNGHQCTVLSPKQARSGMLYVDGTIAVRESEDLTSFIRYRAWGSTVSTLFTYVEKGDRFTIFGHLRSDSYKDSAGQDQHYTYVLVDRVAFGYKPKGKE